MPRCQGQGLEQTASMWASSQVAGAHPGTRQGWRWHCECPKMQPCVSSPCVRWAGSNRGRSLCWPGAQSWASGRCSSPGVAHTQRPRKPVFPTCPHFVMRKGKLVFIKIERAEGSFLLHPKPPHAESHKAEASDPADTDSKRTLRRGKPGPGAQHWPATVPAITAGRSGLGATRSGALT